MDNTDFHNGERGRSPANVINAAELVSWQWRPHAWLLWQMVPQGGITLLAGETASGKSFLGLDLALGLASGRGRAWDMELGSGIRDPCKVRYFCADADPNLIAERVLKLCRGYPTPTFGGTATKNRPGIDVPSALDLDFSQHQFSDPQSFRWLQKEILRQGYQLLIFDGLAQYLPAMADGSAPTVGAFLRGVRQLASQTGVTVLLIHQFNKRQAARTDKYGLPTSQGEERVRGSSELLAGVDTVLLLSRPEANFLGERGRGFLKVVKNRLGQAGARLRFSIVDGEPTNADGVAHNTLCQGASEVRSNSLHLLFERPADPAPVKPRRLVDAAFDQMMRILMEQDQQKFTRLELTKALQERISLPSTRSLTEAFRLLGKEEEVRVERDETGKKRYSWAAPGTGAMEKIMYGMPPVVALDLGSKYLWSKMQQLILRAQIEKMDGNDKNSELVERLTTFMKDQENKEKNAGN